MLVKGAAFAEPVAHHGRTVEAESTVAECAYCHDGVDAINIAICSANCDNRHTHPVLRHYPPLGKEFDYAPAGFLLNLGIRLPDNKIACISCHNLRNRERYHLVLNNQGSKLCFTCHRV
ncbi:MAG: hypothetical protein A2010_00230 [Nitrospirae bacterium GWD2_57_9]|nr:MAG: hypothetical protein A2010_00230 [Nitrospirae bacterium GWD2_57_9]